MTTIKRHVWMVVYQRNVGTLTYNAPTLRELYSSQESAEERARELAPTCSEVFVGQMAEWDTALPAPTVATTIPDRIPLGVALSVVTGRRVEREGDGPVAMAVMAHLAREVAGGEPTAEQGKSPDFLDAVKRRAALLFPAIAHETGDELDDMPPDWGLLWLYTREMSYGATIAMAPLPASDVVTAAAVGGA